MSPGSVNCANCCRRRRTSDERSWSDAFSFERAGPAEISATGTTCLHGVFNPVTVNRQQVIPMRIIARSMLFATGLLFAAVTANAQSYYSGYYYPGYTVYPNDYTYPYPYYYNYVYPWYAGSYYYSPRRLTMIPTSPRAPIRWRRPKGQRSRRLLIRYHLGGGAI